MKNLKEQSQGFIDWSKAPDWAGHWAVTKSGQAWWFETKNWSINTQKGGWSNYTTGDISGGSEKAPSFNFNDNWENSWQSKQALCI